MQQPEEGSGAAYECAIVLEQGTKTSSLGVFFTSVLHSSILATLFNTKDHSFIISGAKSPASLTEIILTYASSILKDTLYTTRPMAARIRCPPPD